MAGKNGRTSISVADVMSAMTTLLAEGTRLTMSPNQVGGRRTNRLAEVARQFSADCVLTFLKDPAGVSGDDNRISLTWCLRQLWAIASDDSVDSRGRLRTSPPSRITAAKALIDVLAQIAAQHPLVAAKLACNNGGPHGPTSGERQAQSDDDFCHPFSRPTATGP